MNPGWFYRDNYLGKTKKGIGKTKNQTILKGHMEFFNGKYNMYFMNNVTPPSNFEIHAMQIADITKNFMVDAELKKYINSYNNDKMDGMEINKFNLEKMVQIIEDVFAKKVIEFDKEGGNTLLSEGMSPDATEAQLARYREILDELIYIHNFFSGGFNQGIASVNGDEFVSKMERIENAINKLEADLDSNTPSGAYFEIPAQSQAKTVSNYVASLGNILKTRLVEIQATIFADKIPHIVALDTSKIYGVSYDIFGNTKSSGKMLRTDTLGFSKEDLDIIQVRYEIGKNQYGPVSLREFFEVVEKASKNYESIKIDNSEQEKLFNAAKFGIQSKSGFNQSPFNDFKIAPIEAVEIGGSSVAADVLKYFILWHNDMHHTKANHDIYNAYFNLCISHNLTYVIGVKNNLIATRNGIYALSDYIEEQWRSAGKIIKAKQLISVGKDGTIPVSVNLSAAKV